MLVWVLRVESDEIKGGIATFAFSTHEKAINELYQYVKRAYYNAVCYELNEVKLDA